jgi:hypothetical protein
MISEIKNIMSSDIIDFKTYRPIDEESFMFLIRVIAGIKSGAGEESFDIEVCTPKLLVR